MNDTTNVRSLMKKEFARSSSIILLLISTRLWLSYANPQPCTCVWKKAVLRTTKLKHLTGWHVNQIHTSDLYHTQIVTFSP